MEKQKVAQGNMAYVLVTVGLSLVSRYFTQAVLDSSLEITQFPTDAVGKPGYIRIDSSDIRRTGDEYWFVFAEKVKNGLFASVAYEFSSQTQFEGDFAERTTITKDGYVFSFHIKQYERDNTHNFEIIDPCTLPDVPLEEELGRVLYLKIGLS